MPSGCTCSTAGRASKPRSTARRSSASRAVTAPARGGARDSVWRSSRRSRAHTGGAPARPRARAEAPTCGWSCRPLLRRAARLAAEGDVAGNDDLALDPVHGHHGPGAECLVASQGTRVDLLPDGELDLALRRHAELFQEAPHRQVEGLFVHQSGISPSPVNSPRASSKEMSRGGRITSDSTSSSSETALPSRETISSIWLHSSLKPVSSPCSTAVTA